MAFSYSTKQPVFCTTTIWKTLVCELSEPSAPRQCRTSGRVEITNKVTVQVWCLRSRRSRCTEMFWHYVETLKTSVSLCSCTKIIWNYVDTAGLVSLYVVFRNLVVLVITSGKTTWGYRALQVSCKLEHGPRHYSRLGALSFGFSPHFLIEFRRFFTNAFRLSSTYPPGARKLSMSTIIRFSSKVPTRLGGFLSINVLNFLRHSIPSWNFSLIDSRG